MATASTEKQELGRYMYQTIIDVSNLLPNLETAYTSSAKLSTLMEKFGGNVKKIVKKKETSSEEKWGSILNELKHSDPEIFVLYQLLTDLKGYDQLKKKLNKAISRHISNTMDQSDGKPLSNLQNCVRSIEDIMKKIDSDGNMSFENKVAVNIILNDVLQKVQTSALGFVVQKEEEKKEQMKLIERIKSLEERMDNKEHIQNDIKNEIKKDFQEQQVALEEVFEKKLQEKLNEHEESLVKRFAEVINTPRVVEQVAKPKETELSRTRERLSTRSREGLSKDKATKK